MDNNGYPRWAVEDYPGAAEDYTEWLTRAIAEHDHTDIHNADPEVAARLIAMVRVKVIERTKEFGNLAERAEMYQAWKANKEGWFRNLPGEYGSLDEFLAAINDPEAKPSSIGSDLSWLVQTLFPSMESLGMDPQKIIETPSISSKLRASVPYMRTAFEEQEGDQLVKTLKDILGAVMDPNISWRALRDMLPKYKGGTDSVWGDIYNLPDYRMIVIRDEDGRMEKFLRRKARGTIEFRGPKDPVELLKELTDSLMGEEE